MATTIQWRLKPQYRKEHADRLWKQYADVQATELAEKLAVYNANDVHFEYREAPKAEKGDR